MPEKSSTLDLWTNGKAELLKAYPDLDQARAPAERLAEEWWAAYEDYQTEAEEIQDLGNGVAFAVFVQSGRPVGSTGWVEFRDARVMTWADGVMERVTTFLDIDEARAAAERLAEERG